MRIAVLKERAEHERRVALVPESAGKLVKAGAEVIVEQGAGHAAGFPDAQYTAAGATMAPSSAQALTGANVVLTVQPPLPAQIGELPPSAVLISLVPAATASDGRAQAGRPADHRARAGARASHHPRAIDGRLVVAGDGRPATKPCSSARATCPADADDDDGGGVADAGQSAHHRRRCGGTAGDCHVAPARRGGVRVRRAGSGQGAGAVARRQLRRGRRHGRRHAAATRASRRRTSRRASSRRWPTTSRTWIWSSRRPRFPASARRC